MNLLGSALLYQLRPQNARKETEIAKLDEALLPAVIPIPGVTGNTGIGVDRLKNSVEKAVGSDIIFNK